MSVRADAHVHRAPVRAADDGVGGEIDDDRGLLVRQTATTTRHGHDLALDGDVEDRGRVTQRDGVGLRLGAGVLDDRADGTGGDAAGLTSRADGRILAVDHPAVDHPRDGGDAVGLVDRFDTAGRHALGRLSERRVGNRGGENKKSG